MDKKEGTGYWLKFFRDAGIPTKTGASYAHVFVENRMHKDMLSELSADYLRLMGITVMGDIIAILRHSKSVHQESLRKVVILQSKNKSSSESSSSSSGSSSSSSDGSSSDEDVQMVEITKPAAKKTLASKLVKPDRTTIVKKEPLPKSKTVQSKNVKSAPLKSQVINKLSSSSSTVKAEEKKPKPSFTGKRKLEDDEKDVEMADAAPAKELTLSSAPTGRSILKIANSSTKKIRPSTDDDIMGPKLPPAKKTVFDRLGSETGLIEVSSTTIEVPKPEIETKFTRIISNVSLPPTLAKIPASLDTSPKVFSVFQRLGGVKEDESRIKPSAASLKYIGVLKTPTTVEKEPIQLKRLGTMRADQPEVPLKQRASNTPPTKTVSTPALKTSGRRLILNRVGLRTQSSNKAGSPLSRLGLKKESSNGVILKTDSLRRLKLPKKESEGIFANPEKLNTSLNVKERLGLSTSSNNRVTKRPSPTRMTGEKLVRIISERSRLRMDEKKVSFGSIEQKIISPRLPQEGSGLKRWNNKSSVHSRLGPVNSF